MELVNAEDLISAIEAWLALWNLYIEFMGRSDFKVSPTLQQENSGGKNKTTLVSLFV